MKEKEYVERTIIAGPVVEKIKFQRIQGKRRRTGSSVSASGRKTGKREANLAAAAKQLARIINGNFRQGDYHLVLDYAPDCLEKLEDYIAEHPFCIEPTTDLKADHREQIRRAAAREMRLFLRRVKRELENKGIPFGYVAITSDIKSGRAARVHHHLIVNKEALPAIKVQWGARGRVTARKLSKPDYSALAVYFVCQVRHANNMNKFTTSRNLVRPVPVDETISADKEVQLPPKACEVDRSEACMGYRYIRYVCLAPETDSETD